MVAKQTKELAAQSIKGAKFLIGKAEKQVAEVIETKGDSFLPSSKTTHFFRLARGLLGISVEKVADLQKVLIYAQTLIGSPPKDKLWLPYLGEALDAGIAALLAMEILEFLARQDVADSKVCGAFLENELVKKIGTQLLKGGSAVLILGAPHNSSKAADLIQEIRGKHTYVFMAGSDKGQTLASQLEREGIAFGWEKGVIPLGPRTSSIVQAFSFLVQIALDEGIGLGKTREILYFIKDKIFVFMMVLGKADRERYAAIAGATSFGIQSVAEFYIPQLLPIYPLA